MWWFQPDSEVKFIDTLKYYQKSLAELSATLSDVEKNYVIENLNLKKKAFSDDEYESSLYLFKTLKKRNLGDMNDLYNAQ